jgi:hypothetical protein
MHWLSAIHSESLEDTMKIQYEFFFENERYEVFNLTFGKSELSLQPFPVENNEPWTKLEFNQCSVCTLEATENIFCPVAHNLSYVLLQFKNDYSYEKVRVKVTSEQRVNEKETSLQDGISTLMGLIMATSGCPILDKFKPMAFMHLPFSNKVETTFRAVSTYLTAQYIRKMNNLTPDWELKNFKAMYASVKQLNSDFAKRLQEIKGSDAIVNALVRLDMFAQSGSVSFSESWMKRLGPIFSAYLDK